MNASDAIVFVVDDDPSVRRGLSRLLRSGGYAVETFGSASEFLESGRQGQCPACVVLDVQLPGLTGPELQEKLHAAGSNIAIVFISAHGDIPMTVQAMKYGAVDFLPKPFDAEMLLKSVAQAIGESVEAQKGLSERASIQQRLETLTEREREVMELIVTGKLNKQVADELGIVEKTIKVHRGRVMEKMQVSSLAELVVLSERMKTSSRSPRKLEITHPAAAQPVPKTEQPTLSPLAAVPPSGANSQRPSSNR